MRGLTCVSHRAEQLGKFIRSSPDVAQHYGGVSKQLSADSSAPEDFVRMIKVNPSGDVLRTLHTALKTRKDSWLSLFIEIGGLDQLADVLSVKLRTQKAPLA